MRKGFEDFESDARCLGVFDELEACAKEAGVELRDLAPLADNSNRGLTGARAVCMLLLVDKKLWKPRAVAELFGISEHVVQRIVAKLRPKTSGSEHVVDRFEKIAGDVALFELAARVFCEVHERCRHPAYEGAYAIVLSALARRS